MQISEKNNKDKILDIALDLFSEIGYDAVGVQTLCENAKITKPTLYYYFGNKEGLLKELLKQNYERLNNLISKNAQYNPIPDIYEKDVFFTLTNVAQGYLDFAKNNENFYNMVLSATFAPNQGTLSKVAGIYNKKQYYIIEKMFEEMSSIHKNMQGSEKRLAWSFIGLINSCIALKANDSAKSFVKQFMHGIYS